MRKLLLSSTLIVFSSFIIAQVPWSPVNVDQQFSNSQKVQQIVQSQWQISSTSQCSDTALYPQSKLTAAANIVPMAKAYIEGIYQTYYAEDSLTIKGVRSPVFLDQDLVVGNTAPVTVIVSVYTLQKNYGNGGCYPGNLLDSVHYTITDNNSGIETIMFKSPIITADSFVVVMDLDSAALANKDTVFFLTNNSTAKDGAKEKLSGSLYSGVYYNNYNEIGSWDVDVFLNPIVAHKVTAGFSPTTTAICIGKSVKFNNSSKVTLSRMFNNYDTISNYTYNWNFGAAGSSNGMSPLVYYNQGGTYPVKLTTTLYGYTGNCMDSAMGSVRVIDTAIAKFGYNLMGGIVQFNDSTKNGYSYSWSFGDGSPVDSTKNPMHTYTGNGSYQVCLTVTDSLNCSSSMYCDSVTITAAGITEEAMTSGLLVAPNPVSNYLNIQTTDHSMLQRITITNIVGEMVLDAPVTSRKTWRCDMTGYANGVYIVTVKSENSLAPYRIIKR